MQVDELKIRKLLRKLWKYENLSRKFLSIGKTYTNLNALQTQMKWMFTITPHRHCFFCQNVNFCFYCWNFWIVFCDVPDWCINSTIHVSWVGNDILQVKSTLVSALLSFSDRSPLVYLILQYVLCLFSTNMVNITKVSYQIFMILADRLFPLKKQIIRSKVDKYPFQ